MNPPDNILDADNCLTPEVFEYLRTWTPEPNLDFAPLMDFVGYIWCYPDCYYADPHNRTYSVLTGGWSGNEAVIEALQQNALFWSLCWMSSHRGGKHVFVLPGVR